jgi:hypothetical protein
MISKTEDNQDNSNNENINHQSPTLSSIENEEILNNQDNYPLECKDRVPTSIIDDSHITPITRNNKRFTSKKIAETEHLDINSSPWINDLQHVIYFCYLCSINKMDSIKYTIQNSEDVKIWQNSWESVHLSDLPFSQSSTFQTNNQVNQTGSFDDDDTTVESQISLKDCHMIHTLLKISENLDQNTLRIAKETKEKNKGFSKLEHHKRLLILNTTENPTQDEVAIEPTEFCKACLLKKTVYRTKEALQQGLKANKEIVFIPSTAFAARLYTVDLVWQSPDQPNGISLFFCAESSVLEDNHSFALLEKLDKTDIQKASKQTLEVPKSYSAALWMLKNLRAVMSLYFGQESSTSLCLKLDQTFQKQ